MCYFSGKLYITYTGSEDGRNVLAVYSVTNGNVSTVKLLDTLVLECVTLEPRVDRHSGRVYLPCGCHGVYVVRYDGNKLVPVTTLKCVANAVNLAVVSSNTLYVSDWTRKTVCLVDVTQDRVTARLQPPLEVRDKCAYYIAVMGDTVLVLHEGRNLVIYQHGVPTPGKVVPWPEGLGKVLCLTSDHHFSFLLCGYYNMYVLDIFGNLTHTIAVPPKCKPSDCTVVRDQLWVASAFGDIVVMPSSQR